MSREKSCPLCDNILDDLPNQDGYVFCNACEKWIKYKQVKKHKENKPTRYSDDY